MNSDPNKDYESSPHVKKLVAKMDAEATGPNSQHIRDHFAEDYDLENEKRYWQSRSDVTASDADIKQAKLASIQKRLDELAVERKQLRGDLDVDFNELRQVPPPRHDQLDWRMRIQAEAWEHWIRLRAMGCNPSVHSICEDMAKWCVRENIHHKFGQNPAAGTIRNTVLGAGHWSPPQFSVDQAKDHVAQLAQVAQTNSSIAA